MQFLSNADINLPDPLYQLLCHSDYTRGNSKYSATDLLKSAQQLQLSRRHPPVEPEDPRENIYRVLGSAVHHILESIGAKNPIAGQTIESRLFSSVNDIDISGQIDIHCTLEEGGLLTDYKHTKVEILKYDTKIEWEQQLNIYAHLLRKHGVEVTQARVVAIFRNWSLTGMNGLYKTTISADGKTVTCKRKPDYPEWGCETIPITLWPDERVAAFIEERVAIHEAAEQLPDDQLPECTEEERWKRDKYLVRKRGVIKPVKVCDTIEEAEQKSAELGALHHISIRHGIPYKCAFYCPSLFECSQIRREGLSVIFED